MRELTIGQWLLVVMGGAVAVPWAVTGVIAAYRHLTRKPPLL